MGFVVFIFFFQAEDGIRDTSVTGVQTCALPIFSLDELPDRFAKVLTPVVIEKPKEPEAVAQKGGDEEKDKEIGRASCRERVKSWVGGVRLKKKHTKRRGTEHCQKKRNSENQTAE